MPVHELIFAGLGKHVSGGGISFGRSVETALIGYVFACNEMPKQKPVVSAYFSARR